MSPNPWRPSLASYSLYNLNRIVDKNQPFLPPLSIFTLLDYSWSSRNLTFWSTYDLLISFISRQSTAVPFRICTNLIHFTQSNAFCQSMKHVHNSSSMSKVRSDIILRIVIPSLVPFPLLNRNSKYILNFHFNSSSKYSCYFLCCMYTDVDCAMVAAFCNFWRLL